MGCVLAGLQSQNLGIGLQKKCCNHCTNMEGLQTCVWLTWQISIIDVQWWLGAIGPTLKWISHGIEINSDVVGHVIQIAITAIIHQWSIIMHQTSSTVHQFPYPRIPSTVLFRSLYAINIPITVAAHHALAVIHSEHAYICILFVLLWVVG